MNNRNRHLQYRKSIYRKRRIRAIVILCVSVAVLAFALFIIIGTVLHKKTKSPTPFEPDDMYSDQETRELASAPTVGAYALPLLQEHRAGAMGSLHAKRLHL